MLNKIVSSGDSKGELTEALSSNLFKSKGFIELPGKYRGENGIDGLYIKDGMLYVIEAKQFSAYLSLKLDPGTEKRFVQMTDERLRQIAVELRRTTDASKKNAATLIDNALDTGNIAKFVTAVDKNAQSLVMVPIK
ncbi:hypothetical protein QCD60_26755 [Pokkaliibacter sp. MBI-7]|uniref:hypothetical protein n=1 Tax=Pokkaliibacter sp. MBI-7 TaxID=3040600 RepID=UPI0024482C49|nr:hypothetical protein [Pokkaliibacter sp. MBI-7]MDH2436136.1 hypothetical protein [Pokkaliibacter sp. MBI-7]